MDKNLKKIQRLASYKQDPNLASFNELSEMSDKIEKLIEVTDPQPIAQAIQELANQVEESKKKYADESTREIEVEIDRNDIKGDRGDKGDQGEKGDKGDAGKDGLDGLDGKNGKDGNDGKNGTDGSSDTPSEIVIKLQSLKDEARLDAKAIKNLPQFTREVIRETGGFRAGAMETPIKDASTGRLFTKDASGAWLITPGSGTTGITSLGGLTGAVQTFARTNDTNVTLIIGSSGTTHTFVMGWTGTLAAARLNANVVQAVNNDTNVTGVISAQTLTLGWQGTLGFTRGGTGATTANDAFNNLAPVQGANAGKFLTTDGTNTSWATVSSGLATLSAIGSSPNLNGATITGTVLNLEPASASFGGVVTTGTQTFAGSKTFSTAPTFSTMTLGSVFFAGTGGVLTQDNTNFFWDDPNNRLGIGINTPSYNVDVIGTIRVSTTANLASATGGTITTSGSYTVHTFTSGGTFTPNGTLAIDYIIVGGGGGGGAMNSSGDTGAGAGGAGGFLSGSTSVAAGAYTVTVGGGGTGGINGSRDPGVAGGSSSFNSLTAVGGGYGGSTPGVGGAGGSGGGGAYLGAGGAGTGGQGNNGGTGGSGVIWGGAGGGGASGSGTNVSSKNGTDGGAGTASSISGASVTYAGGGGGGLGQSGTIAGAGGAGGGGSAVANGGAGGAGGNGTVNTGGGGGGGGRNGAGGNGGSGIVIIRYSTPVTSIATDTSGRVGIGTTSPTAFLNLSAGIASAGFAPLKFVSGTSLTSAEAGAMEFTTDDLFFTITTGTARKRLLMADPVGGLTSTRVPFATTNGRLTDSANMTYVTNRLSPTYITLAAGTATAGTAPLVMTSGTSLTSAIAGALEYDGTQLYFSPVISDRNTLVQTDAGLALTTGGIPFPTTNGYLISNATKFFWDNTNERLGVGTNSPSYLVHFTRASSASVSAHFRVDFTAGYVGAGQGDCMVFSNAVAGTGTGNHFNGTYTGNHGCYGSTAVTTVGTNVGVMSYARYGNINIGAMGAADDVKSGAKNIGVGGYAINPTGAGAQYCGGVFALNTGLNSITFATSALLVDNCTDAQPIALFRDNGTVKVGIYDGGFMFVGGTTTPTALLHLAAGTASANTAPLKFTSGTSLTSPEAGALEFDGGKLWFTATSLIRESLVGVIFTQTADKTVANTTTETSIVGTGVGYGLTLPTNFWLVGKTIELNLEGIYSTVVVTGDTVTVKVKIGSTVLVTKATTSLLAGASGLYWTAKLIITCRTTGASGTVLPSGSVRYQTGVGGTIVENELNNTAVTIDTTASALLDVTVTHSAADAANSVTSTNSTWRVLN